MSITDGRHLLVPQDRGVKEDELQSILNYLLTMHEVKKNKKSQTGEGGNRINRCASCYILRLWPVSQQ